MKEKTLKLSKTTKSENTDAPEEDLFEADQEDEEVEMEEDASVSSSSPSSLPHEDGDSPEIFPAQVTSHDPLRRYLEEVRHYPLLDSAEELTLVTKLRETGDIAAAKALISANLRLVVKIAFEYRTYYSNLLDIIQEGNIGLMKAVSKFDPTKGARLGYYASWWIRSYILKYLLDNFRLVKVGTTQAQKKLFYHLMREKEKLESQGLLSGPKLLAEKLNVREKDIIEMEQRLSGRGAEVSIDAPIGHGDGKGVSHADFLADDQDQADDALAHDELLAKLSNHLITFEKSLNEKELRILKERILAEEPKTLQEVADLYGLTRERARQIEAKIIEKLRIFMKDDL